MKRFSFISYAVLSEDRDSTTPEIVWTGYVQNLHIVSAADAEYFRENRQDIDFDLEINEEIGNEVQGLEDDEEIEK